MHFVPGNRKSKSGDNVHFFTETTFLVSVWKVHICLAYRIYHTGGAVVKWMCYHIFGCCRAHRNDQIYLVWFTPYKDSPAFTTLGSTLFRSDFHLKSCTKFQIIDPRNYPKECLPYYLNQLSEITLCPMGHYGHLSLKIHSIELLYPLV